MKPQSIQLDKEGKELIQKAAKKEGLSISSFIRRSAYLNAQRIMETGHKPTATNESPKESFE